jgi:uncharacterized protein (TIGR02099 family)
MLARMRWIARLLAGLVIAAWSLLLVAWLTLHWGILPHIDEWRPQIAERASRALGVPVQIGNIAGRSGGWMPTVELRGVVLQDIQGRPALELPRVVAAVSARSLFALELRFEQLLIDGAHLAVRRDPNGRVFVAGLDFSGPDSGDRGGANWFFRQPEFVIRGGSLTWIDEQRDATPLSLADMRLVVRNGLRSHELRLDATPPPEWGERFSVQGRFTQSLLADSGDWRRWSGTLHADLPRADVRELRRRVTLPFDLAEGDGAVRAWLDVRDGQPQAVTVDVALREVSLRLAKEVEPLSLAQIEGRLVAQRLEGGGRIAAQQFGFITGDGIRWPRGDLSFAWRDGAGGVTAGGDFHAQRLDLALMAQVASRVPLGDAVRQMLAELKPEGIVNDITASWRGALDKPDSYEVKGVLIGLTLAAKASTEPNAVGRPGLRNATIVLNATEKGGDAKLTMLGGGLEFPGVFEEPLVPLDHLAASLQWRIDAGRQGTAPKVTLFEKDAKFANADAQGDISGMWATGAGNGVARGGRYPGQLELNGKLTGGVATRVARYLPLGIPEDTRSYVARAVRGGHVAGATVRVKGDLWDFPFHRIRNPQDGEFRIAAQVEDVDFAYVPSAAAPATAASAPAAAASAPAAPAWPAFTQVRGELVFDRATMEIRNAQARVYGVELTKVQGGIKNLTDKPVLAMEGMARGPLADMLRYVNTSPVGGWLNKALAQSTATGPADLKLGLAIPLTDAGASTVKGSMALAGNDLRIAPDTPMLGAARARVDFTQKGFAVAGGAARVLGGDATFDGGMLPDGGLRFSGQGVATADGLRRAPEMGALSRLAASLGGQASYRMRMAYTKGHPEIDITSNLVGLTSDLPAPLRKTAEQPLPMRYAISLVPDSLAPGQTPRDTLRLDIGNIVNAQFTRELGAESTRVLRGGIGVLDVVPTPASGVAVHVNVPSLNADAWETIGQRVFGNAIGASTDGGGGYAPNAIAVKAREVITSARRLSNVVAGLSQDDNGLWRGNIDAEQLSGYVEYRPTRRPGVGAGRVYARLARLSLPKSDAEGVESLLDQHTTTVPALDIVVDDLELRGKRLGRVEIDAVNRTTEGVREWWLNRLAMTVPEARFVASGKWSPVGSTIPGKRRALLDFKLDLTDSGAFIDRLGMGRVIKGGKGTLAGEIAWLGSPLSIDYPSLSGRVNVAIDQGQFLKVQPGAARLLSVLSLQSLPRRLALDFRDVFQEGFAFDNVTGDMTIVNGVAYTNNLRMRGVQAAVLMEGSADIQRETQDLRVVVVPEINAGTASLAYAVINPALGLGSFLAQVFLRKPLTEAGTRQFHVTGPWSDPKVERVQRTGNGNGSNAAEAEAASSGEPPRR